MQRGPDGSARAVQDRFQGLSARTSQMPLSCLQASPCIQDLRAAADIARQEIAAGLAVLGIGRGDRRDGAARAGARVFPRRAGVLAAAAEHVGGGGPRIGQIAGGRQFADRLGAGRRRDRAGGVGLVVGCRTASRIGRLRCCSRRRPAPASAPPASGRARHRRARAASTIKAAAGTMAIGTGHASAPETMSDTAPIEHPSWLTGGDFTAADEPLRLFAAWLDEATAAEPRDPTAMTLATVDADGLPNARMVLLKGVDERGFVFYTNMDSQKGRELDVHPQAALVFHWKSLNRQVRVRGAVERVTDGGGRRLFRHPAEAGADRRLGQQAVGAAGKPARLRKGGRALRRQIRARHGAAAAELVGLPHRAAAHRILAGPAVPPARPHRIRARTSGRAVEQDAALSVS